MIHLAALLGVLGISFSAVFVRLAAVSPVTATFFRAVYALPPLALVWALSRGGDPRAPRARVLAFASGVILGIELAFWHKSIALIGVGLATVLANVQVVVVATVAWVLYGERPGIGTALIIGAHLDGRRAHIGPGSTGRVRDGADRRGRARGVCGRMLRRFSADVPRGEPGTRPDGGSAARLDGRHGRGRAAVRALRPGLRVRAVVAGPRVARAARAGVAGDRLAADCAGAAAACPRSRPRFCCSCNRSSRWRGGCCSSPNGCRRFSGSAPRSCWRAWDRSPSRTSRAAR